MRIKNMINKNTKNLIEICIFVFVILAIIFVGFIGMLWLEGC